MTQQTYKVLYIEDNPVDIRFFQEIAGELRGISLDLQTAGTLSSAMEVLKSQSFDLVVSDLGLPDSMGLYTVKQIISAHPELPVIVMTSINDEMLGVKAIKVGAQDYLPKGNFDSGLLARAIKYSVERNSYVFRMFCSGQEKFKVLMRATSSGVAYFDTDLTLRECNEAFLGLSGNVLDMGERVGEKADPRLIDCMKRVFSGEDVLIKAGFEVKPGRAFHTDLFCVPVRSSSGDALGAICIIEKTNPKKPLIDLSS